METLKSVMGGGGGEGGEDMPDREQLVKAVEAAQAAQKAQSQANDLKSKAMAFTDSTKREQLLKEAFDKEVEANGHSKMARRMQSGTWQGLGFGGGIGAATGLGLGAGLGTLLGAITAVPTTGIGMLVGSGVGAFHGPWVKLGGKEQKFEEADPGEVVDALEEERIAQSKQRSEGQAENGNGTGPKARRKPKKLEIRSKKNASPEQTSNTTTENSPTMNGSVSDQKQRRKPKKLEIRSGKARSDASSKPGS